MQQWFILHTYSGHEKKVRDSLKARIRDTVLQNEIIEVLVERKASMRGVIQHREIARRTNCPVLVTPAPESVIGKACEDGVGRQPSLGVRRHPDLRTPGSG